MPYPILPRLASIAHSTARCLVPHTGVSVVSDKGRLQYPKGRRNYCGDAHNENRWDKPGSIQATYAEGQVGRRWCSF
jgi:hypothetical protein